MSRKEKGIEVSPQHGLNPTLATCFWCGKQTGAIALLGRVRSKKGAKDDLEAPHETCLGLEPCDACKAQFAKGVQLIEVTDDDSRFGGNTRFALKDSAGHVHWPTGRFAVLREGAVKGLKAGQHALCDTATMNAVLGGGRKKGTRK